LIVTSLLGGHFDQERLVRYVTDALGRFELQMNIKHTGSIDELIKQHERFSEFKDKAIFEYDLDDIRDFFSGKTENVDKHSWYRWRTPQTPFFAYQKEVSLATAMFIGKTGYGKSSLLNAIIGSNIFPTDDIRSCTIEMDASIYRLGKNPQYYLSLCDLPGVGENENADKRYMRWYTELMSSCRCVVYALRADQRDYSIDLAIFQQLFSTEDDREKVIIALTFADKVEPCQRATELSREQLWSLDQKCDDIEKQFNVPSYRIIPCCSQTGYGLDKLIDEMADTISIACLFDEE